MAARADNGARPGRGTRTGASTDAPRTAQNATTAAASTRGRARRDTAQEILDTAEKLVQTRGFNAFSYGDIAHALGVTKASLHYHFPSKAELGQALIERYAQRFADSLAKIDQSQIAAPEMLAAYASLYATTLRGRRMCLCGMLAAEFATLPTLINDAVVAFFDDNERWLASVLERGRADGTLEFEGRAGDTARMIIGSLEGAMLTTRPYGEVARFNATVDALLARLVPQA